jgi:polar amino acid transport system permease protein
MSDRSHQDPSLAIERAGFRERLELASAGVGFRYKVAAVWAVIFLVIGLFLWAAQFDWPWMADKAGFIFKGLQFTLYMAVGGGALARISRNPVAYGIAGFYTSFFRGTPLIVQMFLIYLALPQVAGNIRDRFELGRGFEQFFTLDAVIAGTLALGLNYGAYMTEIFRAGIQSVSGGQTEAAEALGMTYGQRMRKVILPQALRVIIPPTGNEFIAMMKDTALVSFLGVTAANAEIFRRAQLVGKADIKGLEAFIVAAGLYWALTLLFSYFQGRLEARLGRGYDRSAVAQTKRGAPGPTADPVLHGGEH